MRGSTSCASVRPAWRQRAPRAAARGVARLGCSPPATAPDRVARLPTAVLAFDEPLASPDPDAAWLLRGALDPAIVAEGSRGALNNAHSSRRIAATVALDPA